MRDSLSQILSTLFVIYHSSKAAPETTPIDSIWYDDFVHDVNKDEGWSMNAATYGDLGNPNFNGTAYRYHGPFYKMMGKDVELSYMKRKFYCVEDSVVLASWSYAYCDIADGDDHIVVYLDGSANIDNSPYFHMHGGTPLETIESSNNTFAVAAFKAISFIRDTPCLLTTKWDYKNVTDYYISRRDKETEFEFTLRMKQTNYTNDFAVIFNIRLECRSLSSSSQQTTIEPCANTTEFPYTSTLSAVQSTESVIFTTNPSGNTTASEYTSSSSSVQSTETVIVSISTVGDGVASKSKESQDTIFTLTNLLYFIICCLLILLIAGGILFRIGLKKQKNKYQPPETQDTQSDMDDVEVIDIKVLKENKENEAEAKKFEMDLLRVTTPGKQNEDAPRNKLVNDRQLSADSTQSIEAMYDKVQTSPGNESNDEKVMGHHDNKPFEDEGKAEDTAHKQ